MEYLVPSRGLIGFRTSSSPTPAAPARHHGFEGYEPRVGDISTRISGSLVSDRSGVATAYAMMNLQERGTMFLSPTTEVYEGMIVGENSRVDDMDVNITKEKKLTNVRSAGADVLERLAPPRSLSLEQSLEFCREDECVEVTPEAVRIRKVEPRPDPARPRRRAREEGLIAAGRRDRSGSTDATRASRRASAASRAGPACRAAVAGLVVVALAISGALFVGRGTRPTRRRRPRPPRSVTASMSTAAPSTR